jgi:hypothetical protein
MPCEYVRGFNDRSGGSHMFALWTRQTPPDEDDVNGWAWIMADKVTRIFRRFDSEWAAVVTVVCIIEEVVLTFAPMEDVRWGVDLALNGGQHRTLPRMNLASTSTEAYQAATLAGFKAAEAVFKRERDGE